jgi:hypothetical protein
MGKPYFSDDEVSFLKSTAVGPSGETLDEVIQQTLEERLNRRMKKRVESGDFRVCAARDLAPIFEKALDINQKKLAKDEEFRALMSASGLSFKIDSDWSGLGSNGKKKPASKKKPKKGR